MPIACGEIFDRIGKMKSSSMSYEVSFSMVEIYNEKVQDLLVGAGYRPQGGLKIREHKYCLS